MRSYLLCACFLLLAHGAAAQADDGFQRRDGTMFVVRNGAVRPMPHDVRLPNGRRITREGFVLEPDGRRTELRDGQGCTMLGEPARPILDSRGRLLLHSTGNATVQDEPPRPGFRPGKKGKGKKGKHRGKHGD